jgi:zinc transporter ZupT
MGIEEAEIPDDQLPVSGGRKESLGPVTRTNRPLYLVVIIVLGGVLVIGVVGWLILTANGKTMPEGLAVILGTVAGALVGLVSEQSTR